MIISASRRTDIPAFYSQWFEKRLQEGFCIVRNPMNPKQQRIISLKDEDVCCFVFWTKNAIPFYHIVEKLHNRSIPFYFLYTINAYNSEVEMGLPTLEDRLENFIRMSDCFGISSLVWRYDPIIITPNFTERYHYDAFERICGSLQSYTDTCIISFVHEYRKNRRALKTMQAIVQTDAQKLRIYNNLASISKKYGMQLQVCSDSISSKVNKYAEACISSLRLQNIGVQGVLLKDRNQRKNCQCISSIDIGSYYTCMHKCNYCYAGQRNKKKLHNYHQEMLD